MTQRFIFIGLIILIFFGIAVFSSKVYGETFRLSHPVQHGIIIETLLITMFFMASIMGARITKRTTIGVIPYTVINVIAGIAFYLFLGAIALGIVAVFFVSNGILVPLSVSWGILILFFILAIVSIIQSRFIRVKKYTIALTNAPSSWQGKTAILVTDTHFGLVNQIRFSEKIVSKIMKVNPDFVLHGGDFYDGPTIDTTPITASWKKLTERIPVFYTPGNHEMYGDYVLFLESIRAAGVQVLDDKKIEYDGVDIGGITYRGGKESPEAVAVLTSFDFTPTKASILINHPPTDLHAAHTQNVDLMVSGHTHNGQFWPNHFLVRWIYGIYAYGKRSFDTMQVITSSGVGTFGPPMRLLNSPELVHITFEIK